MASLIHFSETSCLPSHLPLLRISSPKRARSWELIHKPPPQRVPPLTDSTGFPLISRSISARNPAMSNSWEAPILSMIFSLSTSGRPLPNIRVRESESRLMRTSLYS